MSAAQPSARFAPGAQPLPPARMPMLRGGRPLKRWRYVGAFSPGLMLSAADVHVGPFRQRFFAIARPGAALVSATSLRGVSVSAGRLDVRTASVRVALELDETDGVETVHTAGPRGYVWTRKQADVEARGRVELDGESHAFEGRAVVDDTAGYHPRHTRWWWSAGVGRDRGGRRVGWNLVSGVNDERTGSERAVWIDGVPHEVAPVSFADDLASIAFADGRTLRFDEWTARSARTNLLLVRSRYRQPFGSFSGQLDGGIELARGLGVMEFHDAWW